VNFLVAVIGLFGISEILLTMEERLALRGHSARISLKVVWSVWRDLPKYWATLLRSSAIGCWLGITPGGAIAASFMGYNIAKRMSKDKESFGTGRIEGVFAPRPRRTPRAPPPSFRCSRSGFPARAPPRSCWAASWSGA
jgi:TctA family transporter